MASKRRRDDDGSDEAKREPRTRRGAITPPTTPASDYAPGTLAYKGGEGFIQRDGAWVRFSDASIDMKAAFKEACEDSNRLVIAINLLGVRVAGRTKKQICDSVMGLFASAADTRCALPEELVDSVVNLGDPLVDACHMPGHSLRLNWSAWNAIPLSTVPGDPVERRRHPITRARIDEIVFDRALSLRVRRALAYCVGSKDEDGDDVVLPEFKIPASEAEGAVMPLHAGAPVAPEVFDGAIFGWGAAAEEGMDAPPVAAAEEDMVAAAQHGDSLQVAALLAAGANVHARDDVALRTASAEGHADVVSLLLAAGANVHARDDKPLRVASDEGHADVVSLLLEAGANVHAGHDLALRTASDAGDAGIVALLLEAGANVHVRNDTPLRVASRKGHANVVSLLLAAGANVHAARNGALRVASARGHADVVALLRAAGAVP